MKRLCRILCAVLLAVLLAACGSNPTQQTTPETEIPTITLEEYRSMVLDFNTRLMDEAVLLTNAGMYEYNYWNTYSGLSAYGDFDYQDMVESAMDWLAENSDASTETVEAAYDELIAACVTISETNVGEDIPEDIPDLVVALFGAYDGLHSLVTEPSGEIEDFLLQLKDYADAITLFNEDISAGFNEF